MVQGQRDDNEDLASGGGREREENGWEVRDSGFCRVVVRVENPCKVEVSAVGLVWAPQRLKA